MYTIDLDGYVDSKGIRYIGTATRQGDGKYICLADVGGALCRVEVAVTPVEVSTELQDADLRECAKCSIHPSFLCNRCVAARKAAKDKWKGPQAFRVGERVRIACSSKGTIRQVDPNLAVYQIEMDYPSPFRWHQEHELQRID